MKSLHNGLHKCIIKFRHWCFPFPPCKSFELSSYDLPLLYVIAFQKAKQSDLEFSNFSLLSFQYLWNHNILDICVLF